MTLSHLRLAVYGAIAFALLIAIALAWPGGGARPGAFTANSSAPAVPGELIVRFRDGATAEQRDALLAASGMTLKREMSLPGYVVASVPPGQEEQAGAALALSPAVATVERDIIRRPASAPNDPYYSQQWNMPMIHLDAARDISDGSGATVAVVDTGVAFEDYFNAAKNKQFARAPDLSATTFVDPCDATGSVPCWCAQVTANCVCAAGPAPCANELRNPHANDDDGHGTHIAGTVAQDTDNGYGAAGIAPGAAIMPVKVCTNLPGQGYGCPTADLADGVSYAAQQGADVINISITGLQSNGLSDAERAALNLAESLGVVVVAASGNRGDNLVDYPAAVASVISVGAVGMAQQRASYSNYGLGEAGNRLTIVAPGGDPAEEGPTSFIWQQTYDSCRSAIDYTSFPVVTSCYGTSMAAAHVSGVAALLRSAFPGLSSQDIRATLTCSAADLGDPGPDLRYGAGLVQADAALKDLDHDGIPDCIDPSVPTPTPTPLPTFPPPTDNCIAPSITPSPSPSPTPEPTPTETPTPAPSDTATATAPPTDTPTPEPTATPDPMATPTPTPTITPEQPSPPPKKTPTPQPTLFIPGCGDVDCSGAVNAADALGVVAFSASSLPIAQCIGLGYVTCDSVLNAADAVAILRYSGQLPSATGCTMLN